MKTVSLIDFEGQTHVISPLGGGEHTLCGVASDAYCTEDDPHLIWQESVNKKVTCKDCVAIITVCKLIK